MKVGVRSAVRALVMVLGTGCASGPPVYYSRRACHEVEIETDPFGVTTQGNMFHFSDGVQGIGLFEVRGETVLRALWAANGGVRAGVEAGAEGVVALTDGTQLTLAAAADAAPVTDTLGQATFGGPQPRIVTQWSVDFWLTPADLWALAGSYMSAAKLTATGVELLLVPPTGPAVRLQNVAICLAKRFESKP